MPGEIFNPNPTVFATKPTVRKSDLLKQSLWINEKAVQEDNADEVDPIDQDEIFDLIRSIDDPEHPNTLEELRVVSAPQIDVKGNHVMVEFTPTIPHCGMSTLIGLSIRVRLLRSLPDRYKVDIRLKPGSHQSEHAVNKQLNDKERVAAALENQALLDTVEQCLARAGRRGHSE
ncbi:putative iron-sulfur cluster assembly protein [Lyophyllum shimeji]|uniref:Iron-sulfur cluster assembly protein n=1 Tax=Lyophyllum shimeji TaxID=47721 RepID=A0A9P3ULI6_LYOSH|nr:putative iron-sulfur cluster assembly protein [Lyophyllum shimeji]